MRRTLALSAVIAFVMPMRGHTEPAPVSQSEPARSQSERAASQSELAASQSELAVSMASSELDPSLFRGDLTPGDAAQFANHSGHLHGHAHDHAAPGLAHSELFPVPHDCGGFHGEQMMAASLFDSNIPPELQRWRDRIP